MDKLLKMAKAISNNTSNNLQVLANKIKKFFNRESIYRQLKFMVGFILPNHKNIKFNLNIGGGSYTDGKTITIGLPEFMLDKKKVEIMSSLKALTCHESEHVFSSNFDIFKDYLLEVSQYLYIKYGINKNYGKKIAHYINNSIEDGRIEKLNAVRFPGYSKHVRYFRGQWWINQPIKGESELNEFLFAICTQATCGLYPKDWEKYYDKNHEATKIVDDIKFLIDKAINSTSHKKCCDICFDIIKLIENYIIPLMRAESAMLDLMEMLQDYNTSEGGESRENNGGSGSPIHFKKSSKKKEDKQDDENKDGNQNQSGESSEDNNYSNDDKDSKSSKGKSKKSKKGNKDEQDEGLGSPSDNKDIEESKGKGEGSESDDTEGSSKNSGEESDDSNNDSDSKNNNDKNSKQDKNGDSQEDNEIKPSESMGDGKTQDSRDSHINHSDSFNKNGIEDGMTSKEIEKQIQKQLKEAEEEVFQDSQNSLDKAKREDEKEEEAIKKDKEEDEKNTITNDELQKIAKNYRGYRGRPEFRLYKFTGKGIRVPSDIQREIKKLQKEVQDIFLTKKSMTRRGRKTGLLDTSSLWKIGIGDYRVFVKNGKPNDTDYVVYILIDGSGSMSGRKWNDATKACSIIEQSIKELVPLKIVVFNSDGQDVRHYVVKNFHHKDKESRMFEFGTTKYGGQSGNKDGYSIRVATQELFKRPEKHKLLIVLSDGLPSAYSTDREGLQDVHDAVTTARRNGIKLVTIAFGSSYERKENLPAYKVMYEKGIISCDSKKMTTEIARVIRTEISK